MQVNIADKASHPVSDVTMICESTKRKLGVSDQAGSIDLRVKGQTSPGCGYISKCEVATLQNSSGDILGSVTLTPLLRGNEMAVGELTLWIDRGK